MKTGNIHKKAWIVIPAGLLFAAYSAIGWSSCASTIREYTGEERLSGAGVPAVISIKQSRDGTMTAEIDSRYLPAVTVYAEITNVENESTGAGPSLYITGCRLFVNWPNGWTEAGYEASGKYVLSETEDGRWMLNAEDDFELWDIVSGEIRYYDTYYRGEDGLWKVKNRVDRIREVSRVLRDELGFAPFYGHPARGSKYGEAFITEIARFLFPERFKFRKLYEAGELPQAYYDYLEGLAQETPAGGNETAGVPARVLGEGLLWRPEYTAAVLPENLRPLRDSGTLWRDYEEAPELFFSLYNLDHFFHEILPGTIFSLGS